MRLRLSVHRHGLPAANILWDSNGVRPNHPSNGPYTTIAQFLGQVDEIVPLEAEEWGLEDYVVEVNGFECLHYTILAHICKEEDHVIIRPLQHDARRSLRLSGRHQISADGRHLIDGVAFGRPLLRRADRPPVRIPSTKRPRLIFDNRENDDSRVNGTNQLVLRDSDDEEEDELEYDGIEYEGIEQGDLNDGVGDLELIDGSHSLPLSNGRRHSQRLSNPRKRRRTGLGIQAKNAPVAASTTYGLQPHGRRMTRSPSRRSSRSSTRSVRFEGNTLETPATVLAEEEDSEEEDDPDFEPQAMGSDTSESNKENVDPASEGSQEDMDATSSSGNSTSSASDDQTDSNTSSSGSNSASWSSSWSSSPSTSDSDDVNDSAKATSESPTLPTTSAPSTDHVGGKTKSDSGLLTRAESAPVQGLRQTQLRNQRRRNRLKAQKRAAQESALSLTEQAPPLNSEAPATFSSTEQSGAEVLEAKKRLLLGAITSGEEHPTDHVDQSEQAALASSPGALQNLPDEDVQASHEPQKNDAIETSPEDSNQTRRSRLDTASSKRLVFGALGLRTPKSKQDEDALRARLDTSKRKATQVAQEDNVIDFAKQDQSQVVLEAAVDEDFDAELLDSKISIRAVECCYDDVEYSKPPFPFVQRWDPQQQNYFKFRGQRGGGKNKRRKRNKQQYYQEYNGLDGAGYEHAEDDRDNNRVVSGEGNSHFQGNHTIEQMDVDYDEAPTSTHVSRAFPSESDSIQAAVSQQILLDANNYPAEAEDPIGLDLPDLPSDMSQLQPLSTASAQPGVIIAFKQMEMSEKTSWCPVISSYRTAKVNEISDDKFDLTLAARDVPYKEKTYDPETGERLYDKFETISDDGDTDQDDSRLQLSFLDMIEPKLVKSAESINQEPSGQAPVVAGGSEQLKLPEPGDQEMTTTPANRDVPKENQSAEAAAETPFEVDQMDSDLSNSARREYSLLMRNAGFRSDVAAGIDEGFHEVSSVKAGEVHNDDSVIEDAQQTAEHRVETNAKSGGELDERRSVRSSNQEESPNADDMYIEHEVPDISKLGVGQYAVENTSDTVIADSKLQSGRLNEQETTGGDVDGMSELGVTSSAGSTASSASSLVPRLESGSASGSASGSVSSSADRSASSLGGEENEDLYMVHEATDDSVDLNPLPDGTQHGIVKESSGQASQDHEDNTQAATVEDVELPFEPSAPWASFPPDPDSFFKGQYESNDSIHPREHDDPDIFSVDGQDPQKYLSSSSPIKMEQSSDNHQSEAKPSSSSVNGYSSFPSPGGILSQPTRRLREVDEDSDAEDPQSSTPPARGQKTFAQSKESSVHSTKPTESPPIPPTLAEDTFEQVSFSYDLNNDSHAIPARDGATDIPSSPPAIKEEPQDDYEPRAGGIHHCSPEIKVSGSQASHGDRGFPSTAPNPRTSTAEIVDLTLSSDVDGPSSEVEDLRNREKTGGGSTGLPTGPGWIVKKYREKFNRKSYDRSPSQQQQPQQENRSKRGERSRSVV